MGDKVYRIIDKYTRPDEDPEELYLTKEAAKEGMKDPYLHYQGDEHEVVEFELPEGVHLPTFSKFPHHERDEHVKEGGRPYLRVYRPNFFSGYPDEHYLFDNFETMKGWILKRWPGIKKCRINQYPAGIPTEFPEYDLCAWDEDGGWVAAFLNNVEPCEFGGGEEDDDD